MAPDGHSSTVGFRVVLAKGPALPQNPTPNRLVWIPPGTYFMGSPVGELGRDPGETRHQVTLTKGFWVGKDQITSQDFYSLTGVQFFGNPQAPAVPTYAQAISYCSLLTDVERRARRLPNGWVYRLPTEAEWEYMARSGTQTRYYYGDDLANSLFCVYRNCDSNGPFESVGLRPPNLSGIFDICGMRGRRSTLEWCSDKFAPLTAGSAVDPKGPVSGLSGNVVRGVDRSASRAPSSEAGFRVVLGRP